MSVVSHNVGASGLMDSQQSVMGSLDTMMLGSTSEQSAIRPDQPLCMYTRKYIYICVFYSFIHILFIANSSVCNNGIPLLLNMRPILFQYL